MKKICLILVCILPITFCGCFDYHELKNYTIVTGLAIDKDNDYYIVSAELGNISDSGDKVRQNQSTTVVSKTAKSLELATALLTDTTGGELYFKNCELIVLSHEICEDGIYDIIDFLMKTSDFQKTATLAVVNGKARSLFELTPTVDTVVSVEVVDMISSSEKSLANTKTVTAFEFFEKATGDKSAVLPSVQVDSVKKSAKCGGFVFFKNFKKVCEIYEDDAVCFSLLSLDAKKGYFESEQGIGFAIDDCDYKNNRLNIKASAFKNGDGNEIVLQNLIYGKISKLSSFLNGYGIEFSTVMPEIKIELTDRQSALK